MARTDLTVQTISTSGLTPTTEAANVDGEMFINTGNEFMLITNGGGGSINATFQTYASYGGLDLADRVVAVPNGQSRWIGPFVPTLYNREGTDAGKIYVDFSGVTTVTVAVYRLPV